MLKYRALFDDPGAKDQERPMQILTNSLEEVKRWAAGKLGSAVAETAVVHVYMIVETKIDLITKNGKPK